MDKIWMVKFKYGGRKYYKTESAFLDAIGDRHTDIQVTIFEEIETHDALEHKKNIILQREREEQLSVILEDNQEVQTLTQIKNEITKCPDNWTKKAILKKFETRGLSSKTFKNMITDVSIRKYLLHEGPNTINWYKLLLSLHGFKLDDEYNSGYDHRTYKHKKVKTDPSRLANYLQAKEELKLEKKNDKKKSTSV
jgi:hypothetical protein